MGLATGPGRSRRSARCGRARVLAPLLCAGLWLGELLGGAAPAAAYVTVDAYERRGTVYDVELSGDFAYVGSGGRSSGYVDAVALDDPSGLVLANNTPIGTAVRDLYRVGDVLLGAVGFGGGLRIFLISRPDVAIPLGQVPLENARAVVGAGQHAYLLADALYAFDVSDLRRPRETARLALNCGSALALAAEHLYLPCGDRLRVFSLADPAVPVEVASLAFPGLSDMGAIQIAEGHLYLAGNDAALSDEDRIDTLWIADLADPAAPSLLASLASRDGHVEDIEIADGRAYLARRRENRVEVYDVRDPSAPERVGTFHLPWDPLDVEVAGDRAYVATSITGLRVIDLAQPARPAALGSFESEHETLDLALDEDLLFAVQADEGVVVVDVSTPETPTEVGRIHWLEWFSRIAVVGDHAILLNGTEPRTLRVLGEEAPRPVGDWPWQVGFVSEIAIASGVAYLARSFSVDIVDVSDPSAPVWRSNFVCNYPDVTHVEATDRALLQVEWRHRHGDEGVLHVLDRSDPYALVEMSSLVLPHRIRALSSVGDLAYLVDELGALRVIDLSDLSAPVERGSLALSGYATRIAIQGDRAVVVTADDDVTTDTTLFVVDLSNPAQPALLHTFDGQGSFIVEWEGNLLYALGVEALRILDVSDLSAPVEVGSLGGFARAISMGIVGDRVVVGDVDFGTVVVDVSNPEAPTRIHALPSLGPPQSAAYAAPHLYVVDRNGLKTFDVSDPARIRRLGEVWIRGSASRVVLQGQHAFVAMELHGLNVFDVSDPSSPVEIGSLDRWQPWYDVAVLGDQAFVAAGEAGLRILDVSDPSDPVETDALDTIGDVRRVVPALGRVFVGTTSRLYIVQTQSPEGPIVLDDVYRAGGVRDIELQGQRLFVTAGDPHASTSDVLIHVYDSSKRDTLRHLGAFPSRWGEVEVRGAKVYDGIHQVVDFGPEYLAPLTVGIDIAFGSEENRIDLGKPGIVAVTLLGSLSFDVSLVEGASLRFGPAAATPVTTGYPLDLNGDGFLDLVAVFSVEDSGISLGDTQACLRGETENGFAIEGCDAIVTVVDGTPCGVGFELALVLPLLLGWRRARDRRTRRIARPAVARAPTTPPSRARP